MRSCYCCCDCLQAHPSDSALLPWNCTETMMIELGSDYESLTDKT